MFPVYKNSYHTIKYWRKVWKHVYKSKDLLKVKKIKEISFGEGLHHKEYN